jgi:formylglycine-generating enzyme required for sulfatase activity
MVLIPAGDFWMGCNAAKDGGCDPDEKPQHQVTLSAYYMDLDEVTVDDYAGCVSAGGCSPPDTGSGCNWGSGGKGSHPINCVDWFQASAYCAWADKRLPTEAEWEKAARGGCETVAGDCKTGMRTYPWSEAAASCTYAVMSDGGDGCGTGGTSPVGSNSPAGDGPYGLRDMSGNVWEWGADWYDSSYYGTSPSQDPKGPSDGDKRVFRGGSLYDFGASLRAAVRFGDLPETRYSGLGFRCARTP